MQIDKLTDKIFSIKTDKEFEKISLEVFKYQYNNNIVYKTYVDNLNIDIKKIEVIEKIPFLPIEFFKTKKVISGNFEKYDKIFLSSGTNGMQQSKHYVTDIEIYEQSFMKCFELFYGKISNYSIFALLPSYLEREGSSLIYMVDFLIKKTKHRSGFFLYNYDELIENLIFNEKNNIKTILFGVTFALLDLAEKYELNLKYTIILETGGMKGHGKELTKNELYSILKSKLGTNSIHSEYGMTELLSQAYSFENNIFKCPNWMKVLIRDIYDPFTYLAENKSGGINIIDLANINSCSFIEAKDIGKKNLNGNFEVLGRFDNAEIRGCNLLVVNN